MANEWKLGQTSEKFESGGRGPGMISSGKGDHGGISYGVYQLSSNQGSLQEFISKSKYKDDFAGLTVNSQPFQAKWKEIAAKDPNGFAEAQHQYTKDNFYNVQLNKLSNMGINFKERSPAVQDMVWSTSVQFGGNTNLIKNALGKVNVDNLTDRQIIERVQNYKRDNNERLFAKSSPEVRASTLKRAETEKNALVRLAENKDITLDKNSDSPINRPNPTLLMNGSRGDDVKQLQIQLNSLGYKIGQDGIFGKETEKAIRDFQEKNGLGVDGKAGPNTFGKLEAQLQNKPEVSQQNKEIVEKDSQAFSSAYDKTIQFGNVPYGFGKKTPSAKEGIDCSGWVVYLQNNSMDEINKVLGKEIFSKDDKFSSGFDSAAKITQKSIDKNGLIEGKHITKDMLKEGMIIGEDTGPNKHRNDYGIDHITMVVKNPKNGELMISQSSSGKGVHLKSVDDYLAQKQKSGAKLFLTDPLAKARDLLVEKNKEQNIDQKVEKAQPEKAEKEKIQSPEHQKILDLVKKSVTDLYDKNKLPHADKLDNVCCALAKEGIAKKMTGVDYAMEKKGNISLLHTPKGKMVPTHATVNLEIAANTAIDISIKAINNINVNINIMEEQNKQTQQQEINQHPARSMGM